MRLRIALRSPAPRLRVRDFARRSAMEPMPRWRHQPMWSDSPPGPARLDATTTVGTTTRRHQTKSTQSTLAASSARDDDVSASRQAWRGCLVGLRERALRSVLPSRWPTVVLLKDRIRAPAYAQKSAASYRRQPTLLPRWRHQPMWSLCPRRRADRASPRCRRGSSEQHILFFMSARRTK